MNRISEHAIIHPCQTCQRHTLIVRVTGGVVHADLDNITQAGELTARVTGRGTYDVRINTWPPRIRLRWRGLAEIRAPRKYPVVAEHRCNNRLPSEPAPAYNELPIIRPVPIPDEVPF